MLTTLAISGYRSLRSIRLKRLNLSHDRELVSAIEAAAEAKRFFLQKREGETRILDQEIEGDPIDEPPWEWPSR